MFTQSYKRHSKAHLQAMPLEFISVRCVRSFLGKGLDVLALSGLFKRRSLAVLLKVPVDDEPLLWYACRAKSVRMPPGVVDINLLDGEMICTLS